MCIDYTSLNKSCPKDEYPLPRICQIIDSTTSCELLSFLDAYSGYHQINLIIDISFDVFPNLRLQDDMNALLISCSLVLQPECHLGVIEDPK
jgi:hypothetical protein